MTRADRILVLTLAAALLLVWPVVAAGGGTGARAVITSPAGITSVPLDEECTLAIAGSSGGLSVVVEDGSVRVAHSGCPDGTCVATGAISTAGAVIACVPNRVIVRVEGGAGDGLDARVR